MASVRLGSAATVVPRRVHHGLCRAALFLLVLVPSVPSQLSTDPLVLSLATTEHVIGADLGPPSAPSYWSVGETYADLPVTVGDKLVFNYAGPNQHNVFLASSALNYASCSTVDVGMHWREQSERLTARTRTERASWTLCSGAASICFCGSTTCLRSITI